MNLPNQEISGFLLVDKESGPTSFNIIYHLRKITNIRKIGHAGTLDPFATGLMIIAIGRSATKNILNYTKLDKVYEAEFCFGATTDSLDPEKEIIYDQNYQGELDKITLVNTLTDFKGEITQTPPAYSAIKINGQKAYDLARKGREFTIPSRTVHIYDISLLDLRKEEKLAFATFRVHCSSGTYIRSLARDIAKKLGTTGYCTKLNRTAIGTFKLSNSHKLSDINAQNWQNLLIS
jgi:tRNA pseudouridine55 synthase